MPQEVRLRDGTTAWVLPLMRTDKATLREEFENLSEETRRARFLAPVMHLSDTMLQHLVDDVDGENHVALVLSAETEDGVFDPVALARMVRYPEVPDAADLAVTVKDEWHGRGVASALLEVMMQKRPPGVKRIVTEVANDNVASLAMLRRLGPTTAEDNGTGSSEVEVLLVPAEELDVPVEVEVVPVPVPVGAERDAGAPGTTVRIRGPRPPRNPARRQQLRTRDAICPWMM